MILAIRGGEVQIDESDLELVSQYKWHVSDTGYAVWRGIKDGKKQTVRMHRLIMQPPVDMVIDHKDGNKLNNSRGNLRIVTQLDNTRYRHDTVGYTWDAGKNKWMVRYRNSFYGRYETESEAKKAYKLACSGVPYIKQKRKLYNLPTGVSKQFGKYRVRPKRDGVAYWLGNYRTVEEAKQALDKWQEERIAS